LKENNLGVGKPRTQQDLANHHCINLRLPTAGGLYAWELAKHQLVFNHVPIVIRAAAAGLGLACVLEDQATCAF
jgi:DNA-binding transcriptional LysR family regulator